MHIETRETKGKKKYYLAASYRAGAKVAKVRVFLGTNLGEDEVEKLAEKAKDKLERKLQSAKRISDPYRTVLSPNELREVALLTTRVRVKLAHLSEDDWRAFTEEFTYHTNAIEGSTVSREEVRQVLTDKQWPEKSKEEIAETLGVAEAVKHLRQTKDPISMELIRDLHRIVFKNSKPFAGQTRRKSGAEVSVIDSLGRVIHRGAPASQVDPMLRKLTRWYHDSRDEYPPLVLAAVVHNQFETIHPFQDGNGRIGRLLLINILLKHKLPPLNIELQNRSEYYAALGTYQETGNIRPTLELMLKEYRRLRVALKR